MKRLYRRAGIALLCLILSTGLAAATSTKEYIKQLSSKDPKVRANAAYELGCG